MDLKDQQISEYNALKEEIKSNSQLTAQIFTVSITATALLIGYGFQEGNWLIFLSPFAIIFPSLWFISSQLISTVRIATYIRVFLEDDNEGLNWETRLAKSRRYRSKSDSRYTLSITGIYGGIGILCVVLSWIYVEKTNTKIIVLALTSLILIVLLTYLTANIRRCFKSDSYDNYCENWKKVKEAELN